MCQLHRAFYTTLLVWILVSGAALPVARLTSTPLLLSEPKTSRSISLTLSRSSQQSVRAVWENLGSREKSRDPHCHFGQEMTKLEQVTFGISFTYLTDDLRHHMNTVVMNLTVFSESHTDVYYKCGDRTYGFTPIYKFRLHKPEVADESGRIAFIADMSQYDGRHTIKSLSKKAMSGDVSLVVHAGDITYARLFGNYHVWWDYMQAMQNVTTSVMYMSSPGNHEDHYDFGHYRNWMQMPYEESKSTSPFWYSFDYMGIHFVMISTEHDISANSEQYTWINIDMEEANRNRETVPWVIVVGHQPVYCTAVREPEQCWIHVVSKRRQLEEIFHQHNVDVYMSGHIHNYERSYPVYQVKRVQKHFENPTATVHIINGQAGSPQRIDSEFVPDIPWRAYADTVDTNSYLLVKPEINSLHFQYIHSKDDSVVDTFTITRTS